MQHSLDDKVLRLNGVSVRLSRHVILSLVCRVGAGVDSFHFAASGTCGGTRMTPMEEWLISATKSAIVAIDAIAFLVIVTRHDRGGLRHAASSTVLLR